ncbi:DUF3224 domain-containing protein [Shewanella sp. HL-SH4]|uniref:DUF3224 domain-containing protein n=1 Tax=Shewanella sp. HL-SH4 TaxID=3436240 RepID=UPI003EBB3D69
MSKNDIYRGHFQITAWDESTYITFAEGGKQTHAKITQQYDGEITGDANVNYLMTYLNDDHAFFVGYEVINIFISQLKGTITLQHTGEYQNHIASSNFTIVVDAGTGDFKNVTGQGFFKTTDNGQTNYELSLSIPAK